jgi:hypothetical protein
MGKRLITGLLIFALPGVALVSGASGQQAIPSSVEARFGAFIENFWVDWGISNREARCFEEQSYAAQKRCVESKGYTIEISSPQQCKLSIREHVPVTTQLPKSWDGKTIGRAVVAREVDLDLSNLDESLIRKTGPQFFVPFEVTDSSTVIQRITYSDDPERRVSVPSPPLAAKFNFSGSEEEMRKSWFDVRMQWAKSANALGDFNMPMFHVVFEDLPAGRSFLQLSTASFDHAYWRGKQVQAMTDEFVQTIKNILAQCKK